MGTCNPGQLHLNFGTAILIYSDYVRVLFDQKTCRQNVTIWLQNQRRHQFSFDYIQLAIVFGWNYAFRQSHGATLIQHYGFV